MASTTEIKVVVDVPQGEAILLMQAMAKEIVECYLALDELAALVGQPPFTRNRELIGRLEDFVRNLKAKQV